MSASNAAVPETMEGVLAQNRAYRTLCASLEAQMAITTEKGRKHHEAVTTLDSEREANAILTDELTALRSQVSELRADLEAIRNVALVAEDAAHIRQFIASREKARDAQP